MGKTATNLAILLGLITVGFAGYYMYVQKGATTLVVGTNEQVMQNMLNRTQVFIQHSRTLEQIDLDISFFEDERFLSLRSFTTPIKKQPVGRPNPFADTAASGSSGF